MQHVLQEATAITLPELLFKRDIVQKVSKLCYCDLTHGFNCKLFVIAQRPCNKLGGSGLTLNIDD